MDYGKTPRQQMAVTTDTVSSIQVEPNTVAMFTFDNEEMLSIARTLGSYYDLEPLFKDEQAKHIRLYARIEKTKSIDEVTALLNNFKRVKLSVRNGQLIIQSNEMQ